jgi:hypothetical protein
MIDRTSFGCIFAEIPQFHRVFAEILIFWLGSVSEFYKSSEILGLNVIWCISITY